SSFKGKSDLEKYEKAIRLTKYIDRVRKDYTGKIKNKDLALRQLGTAMWVIDVLALRVGGEKGEDEADTVGCCSLRVEHVTFIPRDSSGAESFEIELEFLGKDSMLFKQTINFATYGDIGKLVYRNLKSFCAGKKAAEQVFNTLTPTILNKHLTSIMPGLSAKVFRTYNASITLEKELPSAEELEGLTIQEKMIRYNAANRQVAILCNHQKTVSKSTEVMFENLHERLDTLKSQRRDLVRWKEMVKKGKNVPLRQDDMETVDAIADSLREAHRRRETAASDLEKLAAADALADAKARQKEDQKKRYQQKHMFKQNPCESSIQAKVLRLNEIIRKMETDIRNRDENKEVALGTSKINYMDPRISVAWCKRCEVPIERMFAKTLRDKFNWALAVPPLEV
ncbi:TOP1, partial [Symbiodinium microadriaticum]